MNELSLFSGYGGFNLGFQLAGLKVRTVGYVEWEKYPQEIIKARIKDGYIDDAPIWADIRSFDGTQYRGLVDIITGGFPCQPHSVAGQRKGEADERNLWPDTARVINEVGPRYVLLENVPGILSGDAGRTPYGGQVIGELSELGYDCQWGVVGARDAGAPHKRERWWCLGVADAQRKQDRRLFEGGLQPDAEPSGSSSMGDASVEGLSVSGGERPTVGEPRPQSQPQRPSEDRGGYVDDSEHNGYAPGQDAGSIGPRVHPPPGDEEPQQSQGPSKRRGGTGNMAHPSHDGSHRAKRNEAEQGSNEPPNWISERGDRELGDPDGNAIQGLERESQQGEHQRQVGLSSRTACHPTWPPRPSDRDGWARLLAERPDLAPALTKEAESKFRRVADGPTHRVDRLKALGNGICSPVVREFLTRI